ncbi:MAG TPA: TorF family putative porin [Sphingomonas sp.]|nr:TorF family putative porin [Sphingomonas sp.]
MRTLLLSASALLALAAAPAFAQDTAPPPPISVSGGVSAVTQYRFRGISQSNNRPAVQGSITATHVSGFYVGAWGSSAQAGNSTVDIGGSEIDLYGGYSHALGNSGFTVDGGLYGYLYPGANAGNYYEVYGSLSKLIGPVTARAGVNWAPDQGVFDAAPGADYNIYIYGDLTAAIPTTGFTLHSHVGHTGGGFDYTKDYIDYSVGATYRWKALAFDLSLVGANIGRDDARRAPLLDQNGVPNPRQTYRAAKTVLVGSVTASF